MIRVADAGWHLGTMLARMVSGSSRHSHGAIRFVSYFFYSQLVSFLLRSLSDLLAIIPNVNSSIATTAIPVARAIVLLPESPFSYSLDLFEFFLTYLISVRWVVNSSRTSRQSYGSLQVRKPTLLCRTRHPLRTRLKE